MGHFTPSRDEPNWITCAKQGDVSAFNRLVLAYQTLAYRTALRITGNTETAADATQEAFFSAFKHICSLHGEFKPWLLRIVANECYNQLRSARRHPGISLDAFVEGMDGGEEYLGQSTVESPQDWAERRELDECIQRGLVSLQYDQRLILTLIDVDGLSYQEAAEITGVNIGTMKSRLFRARTNLQAWLCRNGVVIPANSHHVRKNERDSIPVRMAPCQAAC